MDKAAFAQRAGELGFARCAMIEPAPFEGWRDKADTLRRPPTKAVADDPCELLSGATAVIVLLRPYAVFNDTPSMPPLCGYYFGSNAGYFAVKALNAEFPFLKPANLPAKRAAERAFPGCRGKNGLIGTKELGTRVSIHLFVTDAFEPDAAEPEPSACSGCSLCAKACPAGAIGNTLDANKCVRGYLSGEVVPDYVKEQTHALLGCEICQSVCPRNAHLVPVGPGREIAECFSYDALLSPGNNFAGVQALVGKNTSAARIRSQAIILAAKQGGFWGQIEAFLGAGDETVKDAAAWALKNKKTEALSPAFKPVPHANC